MDSRCRECGMRAPGHTDWCPLAAEVTKGPRPGSSRTSASPETSRDESPPVTSLSQPSSAAEALEQKKSTARWRVPVFAVLALGVLVLFLSSPDIRREFPRNPLWWIGSLWITWTLLTDVLTLMRPGPSTPLLEPGPDLLSKRPLDGAATREHEGGGRRFRDHF